MSNKIALLQDAANRLRVSALEQVAKANSGHSTSSISAAEIVATLFFDEMRYDVQHPKHPSADRFILSKGHACPILYAAWEEAGLLTREDVLNFRNFNSNLEGHPTPRLNFIDVATGSLGQGLSCAAGLAYTGKYIDYASYRVYCLLGDGETAEGAIWETASFSSYYKLDNLVAIVDINRLGQSQHTQLSHDLNAYALRFSAFGWHTISLDGHDVSALLAAYAEAKNVKDKPTIILAKTFKGKSLTNIENLDGFHGKPIPLEKCKSIYNLVKDFKRHNWTISKPIYDAPEIDIKNHINKLLQPPQYKLGDKVATREAYGIALLKLAQQNERIIALDADMSNSTFSCHVKNKLPKQFVECFIAEQNMVGVGVGIGCRSRAIPFASTFSAFLGRAFDQIRMSAVSFANIKYIGSHCGVSIGEDGPSQMGLEDIAAFRTIPNAIVLYPTDAVSAEYATELASNHTGIVYIRLSRPANAVIYNNDEKFEIGKSKIIKQSLNDQALIVAGGITVIEALNAYNLLLKEDINVAIVDIFSIKPVDQNLLIEQANRVGGRVITVEDHYPEGGIGETVQSALAHLNNIRVKKLAITQLPRSGKPAECIEAFGISANHIINAVKSFFSN